MGATQVTGNSGDGAVVRYLPIVAEEVRRRLALGVPVELDRDELTSVGNLALAEACAKGVQAIRLAVRGALQNRVKYQVTRNRISGEMPDDTTTAPVRGARVEALLELAANLPSRQKEAVSLVYYCGMSESEAAEEMGCTQQAVSCLLASALKNLREGLVKSNA